MIRTLATFDPFVELERNLNRAFANRTEAGFIPVDVVDSGNALLIKADLPGIDPSNLDVSVEDHVLTIKGTSQTETVTEDAKVFRRERFQGTFTRSVRLDENYDIDAISAESSNGVLSITVPKRPLPEAKTRKIEVKSNPIINN